MKNLLKGGLFLSAMLLLGACSSYNYYSVGSSNKVSKYATFAWLPPVNNTKNQYYDNDVADQKIKDQATANLENRGLRLKAARPDMLVRYTILVDSKTKIYNEPQYTYAGGGYYPRMAYYGNGRRAFYYSYSAPYPVYMGDDIYRVPYKEGTLIIDLIDRVTHKVIWRGYGIGEVNNPEKAINDLPKIVDGIFNKLQINKM